MNRLTKPLKISVEIIILASLALICLIYIGVREKGSINYVLPEFKTLNSDEFTKIQIQKPLNINIELEKTGSGWILSNDSFKADESMVNRLLDFLISVEPVDMVSQSGNLSRYDLDEEKRYTVKGFRGDSLIREIHLGKLSGSENYTYVQFPGDKNVYTLRGTLRSTLNLPPEDFRDRVVMRVNRNEIIRVTFSGPGETRVLSKGGDDSWTDEKGAAWPLEPIQDLLGRFTSLVCSRFLDTSPGGEGFVFTLSGTKDYTLTLFPKTTEGYPAVSSEHPRPFLITEYTGDTLLEVFNPDWGGASPDGGGASPDGGGASPDGGGSPSN